MSSAKPLVDGSRDGWAAIRVSVELASPASVTVTLSTSVIAIRIVLGYNMKTDIPRARRFVRLTRTTMRASITTSRTATPPIAAGIAISMVLMEIVLPEADRSVSGRGSAVCTGMPKASTQNTKPDGRGAPVVIDAEVWTGGILYVVTGRADKVQGCGDLQEDYMPKQNQVRTLVRGLYALSQAANSQIPEDYAVSETCYYVAEVRISGSNTAVQHVHA